MTDDKLKILIISRYFPPYNSISSLRPYSWAKYWAMAGHDVHVLTYPEGIDYNHMLSYDLSAFTMHYVRNPLFEWLKCRVVVEPGHSDKCKSKKTRSFFSKMFAYVINKLAGHLSDCRMPHINDFWEKPACRSLSGHKWDLAISTFAPPVTHAIGNSLKKHDRVRYWIADYRDLWLEHHVTHGIFPFTIYEKWLEAGYVKRADLLTTVSEPLAKVLREKFPRKRVEVYTNGFDQDDIKGLTSTEIFCDNKVRLVYTGTIYPGHQDPSPLFAAIQHLAASGEGSRLLSDFEVVFAGINKEFIDNLASEHQISKWVSHVGMVSRNDALRMQRDAHVLIFFEWNANNSEGILTGKLFEYLSSGTEIWALGSFHDGAASQIISQTYSGRIFCNDIDALCKELKLLLMSKAKRKSAFEAEMINNYNRKCIADRMLETVNNDINPPI